jgi:hypothetical protein
VAIDRERLVSIGQKRFKSLLALDREARSLQRVIGHNTDLTAWRSTQFAFAVVRALEVTAVPPRKHADVIAGRGADREAVRKIENFAGLWKGTSSEPQSVRAVYAFRDVFESLAFGASMLERLSSDGRLRSRFFCGGESRKVGYFDDWKSVLQGSHFKVTLAQPLWHVLAWLTKEKTPLPDSAEQAREWFGVRAPSPAQVHLTDAIVQGFLLSYREWSLWEYVGNKTRTLTDLMALETWRKELAKRFPAIARFHDVISDLFWRDVSSATYGAHRQFDPAAHRAYLERELQKLLDCVSALTALAIEETLSGATVVARFSDWFLCQGHKPKSVPTSEKIERKLGAAFLGSSFRVTIEEVA